MPTKIKLSLLSTGIKCCRFNVLNLYFKTQQCLISFYILISNHSKTKWKRLADLDPSTRLGFFYYLFMNNSGIVFLNLSFLANNLANFLLNQNQRFYSSVFLILNNSFRMISFHIQIECISRNFINILILLIPNKIMH